MEGKSLYKSMNPMVAYQKGLTTWAKWIDLNLDPRQTRVFFRSMSPRHNRYHTDLFCATMNLNTSSNYEYHKVFIVIIFEQGKWLEMLQSEAASSCF